MTAPLDHGTRRRPTAFPLLLGAAGAAACFVALAVAVSQQRTRAFDELTLRGLRSGEDPARPIGPAWVAPAAKAVTALGSLVGMVVATVGADLLFRRRGEGVSQGTDVRRATFLLLVSLLGSLILSEATKRAFDRPRPTVVPHLEQVPPYSFPSGHAMLAAAVYITIALLLLRGQMRWAVRAGVLLAAALVIALIGASRVVLGVHYPTDVLAGWAGGLAWALVCWAAAWYLPGLRERPSPGPPGRS